MQKFSLPRQTNIIFPEFLIDLFGRLRTSDPVIQVQVTQGDPNVNNIISEGEVSGSGTSSSYSTQTASTTLTVGSSDGLRRYRTRVPGLYQAGKSLLYLFTFNLLSSGNLAFVLRSSVSGSIVETVIPQSQWNEDKMDGTGISQINLDQTKAHIGFLGFEWLGVGDVVCGFIHNRIPQIAHKFEHANVISDVYMRTANLFPTSEIQKTSGNVTKRLGYFDDNDGVFLQQTGGSDSIKIICKSLINEGAIDKTGTTYAITRNIGDIFYTGTANSPRAILLFRLNPNYINTHVLVTGIEVTVTDSTNYYLSIVRNPTFSGTVTPSWTTKSNTGIQYDPDPSTDTVTVTNVDSNSIWTVSGNSGKNTASTNNFSINSIDYLGSEYDGTPEIWALVINCDGSNISIPTAVIRFIEEI